MKNKLSIDAQVTCILGLATLFCLPFQRHPPLPVVGTLLTFAGISAGALAVLNVIRGHRSLASFFLGVYLLMDIRGVVIAHASSYVGPVTTLGVAAISISFLGWIRRGYVGIVVNHDDSMSEGTHVQEGFRVVLKWPWQKVVSTRIVEIHCSNDRENSSANTPFFIVIVRHKHEPTCRD